MDNKFYTVFVNFVPPLKINYLKNSGIEMLLIYNHDRRSSDTHDYEYYHDNWLV